MTAIKKEIAHEVARRVTKKKYLSALFFVTLRVPWWAIPFGMTTTENSGIS